MCSICASATRRDNFLFCKSSSSGVLHNTILPPSRLTSSPTRSRYKASIAPTEHTGTPTEDTGKIEDVDGDIYFKYFVFLLIRI